MKELTQEQIERITDIYNDEEKMEDVYLRKATLNDVLEAAKWIYNFERILNEGVNEEDDLIPFLCFGMYSKMPRNIYELVDSFEDYLRFLQPADTYGKNLSLAYSKSVSNYPMVFFIQEEEVTLTKEYLKERYSQIGINIKEKFAAEKFNYIDEAKCSFLDEYGIRYIDFLKPELKKKVLEYHLKKKKKKTVFNGLLTQGILTSEVLKELNLTDNVLGDMLLSSMRELINKNIRLENLTKLKKFKKISEALTDSVLLTLVEKLIKEAEKEKIKPSQIEVALVMFFHYLGKNIQEDLPEAALLLAVALDEEVDV